MVTVRELTSSADPGLDELGHGKTNSLVQPGELCTSALLALPF